MQTWRRILRSGWCLYAFACAKQTAIPQAPVKPVLPLVSAAIDSNDNKITDALERGTPGVSTKIAVVLKAPVEPEDLAAFEQQGGRVDYVFKAVSYGFIGHIDSHRIGALAIDLGDHLHLISELYASARLGDVETRQARVRTVWPTTQGSSNVVIAVMDSGIDGSHPDFAGRIAFWKDYSTSAHPTPSDINGHGTHVAGLAMGLGAAFGATGSTGTLRFTVTDKDTLAQNVRQDVPATAPLTVSMQAQFAPSTSASLVRLLVDPSGGQHTFPLISGVGSLSLPPTSLPSGWNLQTYVVPASPLGRYALSYTVEGYPVSPDGFPTMSGVAPASPVYAAKVFADDDANDGSELIMAMDELLDNRIASHVKVLNLSLSSICPYGDPISRAAVATLVNNGIVTVVSAGNRGPDDLVRDPGLSAPAITVGSTSLAGQVSVYTSIGPTGIDATTDMKPDILAPAGAPYVGALAADSNSADGRSVAMQDVQPNDYRALTGTSMAAPVVAGAAALVIDALEQSGHVWDFFTSQDTLLVKNVLLATATETNAPREGSTHNPPTLGRAAAPKDNVEGYGVLNADAAIEAITIPFSNPLTATVTPGEAGATKRAWARRVQLPQGATAQFTLAMQAGLDQDLYIYAGTPDAKGNPIILASSTNPNLGVTETASLTSAISQTIYVVAKHVSGEGTFSLLGEIGDAPPNTPPGGPVALLTRTLTSDKGNPSVSVWSEFVTFTYVAIGTVANGPPSGGVEFKTSGPLVPDGVPGGTLGTVPLVADGPGCAGQPSPCSSAVFTTSNLVPYPGALRISANFLGSPAYTAAAFTWLNNTGASANHTVNPLPTALTLSRTPTGAKAIRGALISLYAQLTTTCPSVCAVSPPLGAITFNTPCGALPSFTRQAVGPALRVRCDYPYVATTISQSNIFATYSDNPFGAPATYLSSVSSPTTAVEWDGVRIVRAAGFTSPSAANAPVTFELSTQGAGTVVLVDGNCADSPPAPVVGTVFFDNPSSVMLTESVTTSTLPSGTHRLRACNFIAGQLIDASNWNVPTFLDHTVSAGRPVVATTTALTSTPSPTTPYGMPVDFTALVTPANAGAVTMTIDGVKSAPITPDASGNVVRTPLLEVGTHSASADYSVTAGFLGSSAVLSPQHQVTKAEPSLQLALSPPGPFYAVTRVVMTATVMPAAGSLLSAALPMGSVTFRDGATVICQSVPLSYLGGIASALCIQNAPVVGAHAITASYEPGVDPHYVAPADATAAFSFVTPADTTLGLTAPSASSVWGENVTFTLAVTSNGGASGASGTATFRRENDVLCADIAVVDGIALCSTATLPLGDAQNVSVTYSGDGAFASGTAYTSQSVTKAAALTSVSSSSQPTLVGTPVTITVSATAKAPGAGQLTGTVDLIFDDGALAVTGSTGLALDASAHASFTTSALPPGPHDVRAHYAGDTHFLASARADEATFEQHVALTAGLTVSKSPTGSTTYGDSVSLQATVSGGPPTAIGSVGFALDGGTPQQVALDGTARAIFTTSAPTVGTHHIIVTYPGDSFHTAPADVDVTHTVTQVGSTVTLSSSAQPSVANNDVTLTATVALASGNGTASGNVQFSSDGSILAIVPLLAGTGPTWSAALTLSTLPVGTHAIVAEYVGDTNVSASLSSTLTQVVQLTAVTHIAVSFTPDPVTFGASTTALVALTTDTGDPISGSIELLEDGLSLGTFILDGNGQALIDLSNIANADLGVGTHTVTVTYAGNALIPAAGTSVQLSIAKAPATVGLSSSLLSLVWGQSPQLTAQVSSSAPSGLLPANVTFYDGATTLGASALADDASATFSALNLTPGTHVVSAQYAGTTTHAAATSATVAVTVAKAATETTVSAASNPAAAGAPFTLLATVSAVAPGAGNPSGVVTFTRDGATLGTGAVNAAGIASLQVASLANGSYTVEATYAGDANFVASSSARGSAWFVVGTNAVVSVTATPSTVLYGDAALMTISVASDNGRTPEGAVTLTVGDASLGQLNLSNGAASAMAPGSLLPGTYAVSAVYSGDGTHDAGGTGTATFIVQPRPTRVQLAQDADTSSVGTPVLLTATLGADAPANGPVSFFDGPTKIAAAVVATAGVATFSTDELSAGTHALSAQFDGAPGYAPSSSELLTHTVNDAQGNGQGNFAPGGCHCRQSRGLDWSWVIGGALVMLARVRARRHGHQNNNVGFLLVVSEQPGPALEEND